jgi:HPt (histidine-containing phosphotransfer) domain-containing protein
MNDYVTKPIDADELLNVLSKWLCEERELEEEYIEEPEKKKAQSEPSSFYENLDLAGVDVNSALRRLRGNMKLFIRLLKEFSVEYRDVGDKIRESLDSGDFETARRTVHTLKGLAGNLSANDLQRAARDLEKVIEEEDVSRMEDYLMVVEDELKQVLISVRVFGDDSGVLPDTVEPEEKTETAGKVDQKELEMELNKLNTLLIEKNIESENCMESVKGLMKQGNFKEIQKEMEEMEEQISRFDFKNAQKNLNKIADTLQIELLYEQ